MNTNSDYFAMVKDCSNINDEYDFFDLVIAHTGNYVSRNKFLSWFKLLGEFIPAEHLYQPYTELLGDIHVVKGREYYSDFFKPDILEKIRKVNRHDTVENPKLISLLDNEGYLTVYLGHCGKTLHNCNSWTLKKEDAIHMGAIYALFQKSPEFYCVTGKVKLNDVIASINVRGRDEVIVLPKNVSNKTKDFFDYSDDKVPQWWTWWA